MALRRLWRYAALVLALALTGTALFGAVHALIIVPIWRRLLGGLPFALVAAAAITWGYTELLNSRRILPGLWHGALYGCLLWVSVLPTTLLGALFRVTGLHPRLGTLELAAELVAAGATGAFLGLLARSRRLAICFTLLVVALVLAMAGPIAVTNGRRPLLLFLGFVPIYLGAGVVLSAAHRLLRLHRIDSAV